MSLYDYSCTYRFGPDETWPGTLSHDWACSYCGFKPTCAWWS